MKKVFLLAAIVMTVLALLSGGCVSLEEEDEEDRETTTINNGGGGNGGTPVCGNNVCETGEATSCPADCNDDTPVICTSDDPGCVVDDEFFGNDYALPWAGEWNTTFYNNCCASNEDFIGIDLYGHDYADGNRVRCTPSDLLLSTGGCDASIHSLDKLFTCQTTDGTTYTSEWAPCGNSVIGFYNPLPPGSPHPYFDWDDGAGIFDCPKTIMERVINDGGVEVREPYWHYQCW